MKSFFSYLAIPILIAGCNARNDSGRKEEVSTKTPTQNQKAMQDTTPKVTGIGGIFFRAKDPKATKAWYSEHLGIDSGDYGATFESRNADRPDEINTLAWNAFDENTDYFDPSQKQFMINYRVQNIEGLVRNLRAAGATIVDTIESYSYGKFVHIMDPEGNKIELWEPVDEPLTEAEADTTK